MEVRPEDPPERRSPVSSPGEVADAARLGPDSSTLFRAALILYGLMLAAVAAWSLLSGDSVVYASAEAERRGISPLRDAAVGVVAAAAAILASEQLPRTQWGEKLARGLAELIGKRSVPECIALALASGVAEEALFRGVLQPRIGLVAASLLFGIVHFAPRRDLLPWMGFAIVAGLLFGGIFAATGNLLAPVVAHVGINAVNLRLLGVRYQ